jgi:predicted nucleic acid-binding Zn ribbon protein
VNRADAKDTPPQKKNNNNKIKKNSTLNTMIRNVLRQSGFNKTNKQESGKKKKSQFQCYTTEGEKKVILT